MNIDFEAKKTAKGEPEKIKKDYEKMKANEYELAMMSRQFVEDKNVKFTVYNKRSVPPQSDSGENSATALNNDRNQLKR